MESFSGNQSAILTIGGKRESERILIMGMAIECHEHKVSTLKSSKLSLLGLLCAENFISEIIKKVTDRNTQN